MTTLFSLDGSVRTMWDGKAPRVRASSPSGTVDGGRRTGRFRLSLDVEALTHRINTAVDGTQTVYRETELPDVFNLIHVDIWKSC